MFKKTLHVDDLEYLVSLLNSGIPLSSCFAILKNRKNEALFDKIMSSLNSGGMIEEIVLPYLPKDLKEFFTGFIKNVSFLDALSLSLKFSRELMDQKNRFSKELVYPLVLFFFTTTALFFFDIFGLDAVFSLLQGFKTDLSIYQDIRILIRVFIFTIYISTVIFLILAVYFTNKKHITMFYLLLSRYFPNSLLHTYYTCQFVSVLLICNEKGYKTKESLEMLKGLKSKPVISLLGFHMDESLLSGESFNNASKQIYFDDTLSRFIKVASFSNEFENVLSSYTTLSQMKIEKKIRQYTLSIQIGTYIFLGLLIVFVYQVLFMPMQAISMM